MEVRILIDTKPKGGEYTRAGGVVKVDDAEGSRLIYLGFAEKYTKPKKTTKK